MAWLQNLAGRAEDLLNKIDQNAATVLNDTNNKLMEKEKRRMMSDVIPEEKISHDVKEEVVNIENEKQIFSENPLVLKRNESEDKFHDEQEASSVDFPLQNEASDTVVEDIFEKSFKGDSQSAKSLSSHYSDNIEYIEKISQLETEIENLNKQLLNLQHLYSEVRNEKANLKSQVEASNYLVATAQSEMEQYKARAQRILQEKEDLITLKNQDKSENSDHILSNYNEELKKEVEFQQSKNLELTEKLKELAQKNSFLQQQIVLTQNASHQSNQALQENLMSEKKYRMIAEEECRIKSNELQLKMQELSQHYQIIQSKNEEINSLQDALKSKVSIKANSDIEMQIKSLTDTLLVKQSNLETVTTERNALRLQLEKLENEYHNNLAQLQRAQVRVVNMNDTDDVKSQVPQFMRVSPFDAGVTRRVKHAYSTVDAISVRTGIFLRRYPLARIFVFCYMVLLHFWALIVLFIYAPSTR